ncbi:MAG: hypothetical protein ABI747_00685 [Candidatus Moraniibacteriota bacterium]
METTETTSPVGECKDCQLHMAEQTANDETSMAFLLALVPVMVITLLQETNLLF